MSKHLTIVPSGPAHATIAQLQTQSLTTVVQQDIERAILAGEYAPGSKLVEAILAEKMGVSRGSVREAFRMLEEVGLLHTEKNHGVFVRDTTIDEAVEIFDWRATAEELVGRRLAANITAAQLKEILALVAAMERSVEARDPREYHTQHLAFHNRLVEMAGIHEITSAYRKLIKELALFLRLNLADDWLMPISAIEHRYIVKVLASGNAEVAGRVMSEHVMESKVRTIKNNLQRQAHLAIEVRKNSDDNIEY